jgi:hypothetical protein
VTHYLLENISSQIWIAKTNRRVFIWGKIWFYMKTLWVNFEAISSCDYVCAFNVHIRKGTISHFHLLSFHWLLAESSLKNHQSISLNFILVFSLLGPHLKWASLRKLLQEILNIIWISFYFSFVKNYFLIVIFTLRCSHVHVYRIKNFDSVYNFCTLHFATLLSQVCEHLELQPHFYILFFGDINNILKYCYLLT